MNFLQVLLREWRHFQRGIPHANPSVFTIVIPESFFPLDLHYRQLEPSRDRGGHSRGMVIRTSRESNFQKHGKTCRTQFAVVISTGERMEMQSKLREKARDFLAKRRTTVARRGEKIHEEAHGFFSPTRNEESRFLRPHAQCKSRLQRFLPT